MQLNRISPALTLTRSPNVQRAGVEVNIDALRDALLEFRPNAQTEITKELIDDAIPTVVKYLQLKNGNSPAAYRFTNSLLNALHNDTFESEVRAASKGEGLIGMLRLLDSGWRDS